VTRPLVAWAAPADSPSTADHPLLRLSAYDLTCRFAYGLTYRSSAGVRREGISPDLGLSLTIPVHRFGHGFLRLGLARPDLLTGTICDSHPQRAESFAPHLLLIYTTARPADLAGATALGPTMASIYNASTRRRNPRRSRKWASDCRCSSQATQVFSRSGAWTFGLFQTRAYDAGARQPLAEQATGSLTGCARLRVTRRQAGRALRCWPSPALEP
jgi:hypothetical protein